MDDGDVNDTSNLTQLLQYDYTERPETYIVPVLFSFIFFVGTIGNGSLVLIFFRHKHMINVPNIYILSLALGDLLVLLSCIPFTSTVYTVKIIFKNYWLLIPFFIPLLSYILFYLILLSFFIISITVMKRIYRFFYNSNIPRHSLPLQKKKKCKIVTLDKNYPT